MTFPRKEIVRDLVGDAAYVEDARWRLFEDLDGELQGKHVLLQLGDKAWTMLSADEFRRMATRILGQL